MIDLILTTNIHPDFQELVDLLDEELWIRNGAEQGEFLRFNIIRDSDTVVIAYEDARPVGIGCYRPLSDGVAEIKRMFVKSAHRGKGIATLILNALENKAKEEGFKTAILETGTRLPEALSLYQKSGYEITEKWGPYISVAESICMKKAL